MRARPRGYHLVTGEIVAAIADLSLCRVGLVHLHLLHTSASLAINENASPDVLSDFGKFFDRLVPDDTNYFDHTVEGADDMPAHIKSALTGVGITIPVRDGRLLLGTWQGIYLCEHRNAGGRRSLVATLSGEPVASVGSPL